MRQRSLFSERFDTSDSWFEEALAALNVSDESPNWIDRFGVALQHHCQRYKEEIRVLSLFSGAGGLDIGFHDAGFKIVECNEIAQTFADTLYLNSEASGPLHSSNIVCKDVSDYDPAIEDIDFVIGGPPCQTFSAAGARAAGVNGVDDDRGNLFKQYVRILKKLRPKGFLFENVYRIIGAQGGKPWQLIQDAFQTAGYQLHWRILDSADFGVPQFRERLIIIGLESGEYKFPYPTHGPDSRDDRPYYSAGRAIQDLAVDNEPNEIGGRHGHLLNDIPPGLNYSFYTERMGHPTPYFAWRSKFSDYLYKADPDTPVRTIKAQGGQYTGPFHWHNRPFAIEELKRLQTFPDSYRISGNRQKIIQQIGNSVPPQLSRILALSIAQQVFARSLPFDMELLHHSTKLGFRARKSKRTKLYAQKAKEAINKLYPEEKEERSLMLYKKQDYQTLNANLTLSTTNANLWDYCFSYEIENGKIDIQVWDKKKSTDIKYQYTIVPTQDTITTISSISMRSFSADIQSVTAIWKYLECLARTVFHKDDLVQLFGYYQYANNFSISLTIEDPTLSRESIWQTLSHVSSGYLVGTSYPLKTFAAAYGIDEKRLLVHLVELKKLGYEIRNHNTNSQIAEGHLLIQYSFPSLNERSLQRLTAL